MPSTRCISSVIILTAVTGILSVSSAGAAESVRRAPNGPKIIIIDLGLLPQGTASNGLAINNEPIAIGLANDNSFALLRPFWDGNTGANVGNAGNMIPANTAIPEHINESRVMAGS